jgi:hypothetical protein
MRALDGFDSSAGERGERLLRPTKAAAHQLVLAQPHGEFGTSLHQTKLDVGARHAGGIEL